MNVGINITGGIYPVAIGSTVSQYIFATPSEIDYFAANGFSNIRLPLNWETLQSALYSDLNQSYLDALKETVATITSRGLDVILDLHAYGSYDGSLIGSTTVPESALADVWGRLAAVFKGDPHVIFGLMNEPQVTDEGTWLTTVNGAIAAIRTAGAVSQEVLVSGLGWDGANNWVDNGNAATLGAAGAVQDSANNFAFDVHQYLDAYGAGQSTEIASVNVGVERLETITEWARATGVRLFLSETGVGVEPASVQALVAMLDYMQTNQDAWQGVSYWAAGQTWIDYIFSVEPEYGLLDQAQIGPLVAAGDAAAITTTLGNGDRQTVICPGPDMPYLVDISAADGTLLSRSLYAPDGTLERKVSLGADATVQLTITSGLATGLSSRIETYNAQRHLQTRTDVAVDGTHTVSIYRTDGSTSETDNYAADGRELDQAINNDDGTHQNRHWYADGGSVVQSFDPSWSLLSQTTLDANGQVSSVYVPQADGTKVVRNYGPGTNTPLETDHYDAGWGLLSRTLQDATGTWTIWNYSANGSIATVEIYDAAWRLETRTTLDGHGQRTQLLAEQADGSHLVTDYTPGGSAPDTIARFAADWTLQERDTLASGAVIARDIVSSDGSHTVESLDSASPSTVRQIEQYDAGWHLLSRTIFATNGQRTQLLAEQADGSHLVTDYTPGGSTPDTITRFAPDWTFEERNTLDASGAVTAYSIASNASINPMSLGSNSVPFTDATGNPLHAPGVIADLAAEQGNLADTANSSPKTIDVSRFFDQKTGTHFYTQDQSERQSVLTTRPDLLPEGPNGVGLTAVNPSSNDPNAGPVYRFFDTVQGTHFFTASTTERDVAIASRPDLVYEPASTFYEPAQSQSGDTPVYRFFDTNYGTHFYTDDPNERASILQTRPDLIQEGVGFYEPPRNPSI